MLFGPDRPQQHPQEPPPSLSTGDRGFWDRTRKPTKKEEKIFFSVNLRLKALPLILTQGIVTVTIPNSSVTHTHTRNRMWFIIPCPLICGNLRHEWYCSQM